jgi:hypothetical protein
MVISPDNEMYSGIMPLVKQVLGTGPSANATDPPRPLAGGAHKSRIPQRRFVYNRAREHQQMAEAEKTRNRHPNAQLVLPVRQAVDQAFFFVITGSGGEAKLLRRVS